MMFFKLNTVSDKVFNYNSSFLQWDIYLSRKIFYSTGPDIKRGLKCLSLKEKGPLIKVGKIIRFELSSTIGLNL
jgi:hypothetical protein